VPNEKKKKQSGFGQRQRNKERKNNGETKKKTTPKPGRRLTRNKRESNVRDDESSRNRI
jgi:hypothetical protein